MPHLDLSYLINNVTDDKDFIKEVLTVFMSTLVPDIQALEDAIYQKNHLQIKRSAHKVKSSFRSLGMHVMTDRLQEIEDMGHNNFDIRVIQPLFATFKKDLPAVKEEVQNFIDN
jgi:HPt (histidine-containing phosphotransfer) domain-containing protein